MAKDKNFLNASDVADYMDVSIPMAYKIIRRLNDELEEQGYLTVSSKVSKRYFEQQIYGCTYAV